MITFMAHIHNLTSPSAIAAWHLTIPLYCVSVAMIHLGLHISQGLLLVSRHNPKHVWLDGKPDITSIKFKQLSTKLESANY